MKNYYLVFVSAVLVFFASNTSADFDPSINQNVCEIKQNLHQNLANILVNDIGRDVLTELLEILSNICMDPKSHDAIIFLLDIATDHLTNSIITESLGNTFYWTSMAIKDPNFQLVLHEAMKGVNTMFDRIDVLKPMLTTIFTNVNRLLVDPNFNTTFELVVENISAWFKLKNRAIYSTSSYLMRPQKFFNLVSPTSSRQSADKITRSTSKKN